ncbi:protein-glutamate O-methyltransferase CheR [Gammaproteobacteria bacterium AB-CW1]|uniref:protein-glutamate O-methyltransferase n=1 Tax=Natronospira elongata TaxID=3110268 RepID=A0AAP6MKR4_9GAMM|nr:protein-glutamate O-methyltransferase CheR [Gammaproteobacteria bacterium AB-CW1]
MSDAATQMSDASFEMFRALFLDRLGLYFEDHRRYLVEKRVAGRMQALGLQRHEDYLALIKGKQGLEEFQALTNAITVNETYFNRENYQLQCLTRHLLPEIMESRRQLGVSEREPVRIWSIPCSTGEEAYSLAMQLLEDWPDVDRHEVEIHASDVDTDALAKARQGIYGERALRLLPAVRRQRFFQPAGDGCQRIHEAIRRSVIFSQVNLSTDEWRNAMPTMDVIFCRNLLIYFNDATRARAAARLFDALRPGGFVCLGHSESMHRMNDAFLYRRFPEAIVYQRPPQQTSSLPGKTAIGVDDLACG